MPRFLGFLRHEIGKRPTPKKAERVATSKPSTAEHVLCLSQVIKCLVEWLPFGKQSR